MAKRNLTSLANKIKADLSDLNSYLGKLEEFYVEEKNIEESMVKLESDIGIFGEKLKEISSERKKLLSEPRVKMLCILNEASIW